MATLYLDKVWINLLDTGQYVTSFSSRDKSITRSMKGEVRQYANGRQRAVSSKGIKGTFPVVLIDVTLTQIEKLESWMGQTVVFRDTRGRRFFGTLFEVTQQDKAHPQYYDVSITLNEVTYIEGT